MTVALWKTGDFVRYRDWPVMSVVALDGLYLVWCEWLVLQDDGTVRTLRKRRCRFWSLELVAADPSVP